MSALLTPDSNYSVNAAYGQNSFDIPSVETIQTWLSAEVAELLSLAPGEIEAQEPFANYGLSSMTGVLLAGDIEEWLGIKIDPVVAWDYPTVESLASYLADALRRSTDEA
jgi:acyl carrier protein